MIKKFLANLVNWSGQREDFSKSQFRTGQKEQDKLSREHNEQFMADKDREYISERKIPVEEQILGPSDPALREEGK